MKNIKNFFLTILGFAIIAVAVWLVLLLARLFLINIQKLNTELATGMLAVSGTIIVSVVSITLGRYFERKKEIEVRQREKKIEIYEKFMEQWFRLLVPAKEEDQAKATQGVPSRELIEFLTEFTRKLTLWGSNGVILKYSKFRYLLLSDGNDAVENLYSFERVIFEIRKDLNNSNFGLKKGDILSLFINDLKR